MSRDELRRQPILNAATLAAGQRGQPILDVEMALARVREEEPR
jgi:hypothetical protein